MKLLVVFFSIFFFCACERAQNRGYEGPNIIEQAINKKKLEIFRLHMESMQPTQAQKLAIAHQQLNSKIDLATIKSDDVSTAVYLIGSRDEASDYSVEEYTPVEGARRRPFIFSKPKPGRDYTINNSNAQFNERKEADALIASCFTNQRIEFKRITDRFPKLIVMLETREILITNFPTEKVKKWESPDTRLESSEISASYSYENVTFNNVLYIIVPNLWIDGYGYSQGQTAREYCHGLVTAEIATEGLIKQIKGITSDITLDLTVEQKMELMK